MSSLKEKIKILDEKFKTSFNKMITTPKVNEILGKAKIPVDRIVNEDKLNNIVRYGLVGMLVLVSYLMFFSGTTTYKGNELKRYIVSTENIAKHIKNKGLKSPSFELKELKTVKLTKNMVDNGTYSYQLIEDTISKFIVENIESFVDIETSLKESAKKRFNEISYRNSSIGKYADKAKIDRKEFFNEKTFLDAMASGKPISNDAIIKKLKEDGIGHQHNFKSGVFAIDFSKYPSYEQWEDEYLQNIEKVINEKAIEKLRKKVSLEISEKIATISIYFKGENWIRDIDSQIISSVFDEKIKHVDIFNHIIKNGYLGFIESQISNGRKPEEIDKYVSSTLKTLKEINSKVSSNIVDAIENENLSFDEFYAKIGKEGIDNLRSKFGIDPIENLFAFIRDYKILESKRTEFSDKAKSLLKNEKLKEDFRKFIKSEYPRLSESDLEIIGEGFFNDELDKAIEKYYDNELSKHIAEKLIRPYYYAILKVTQMEKGLKEQITFEEQYNVTKYRFPEQLQKLADTIVEKMSTSSKQEILQDSLALDHPDYNTKYSDDIKYFHYFNKKYISPSGGYSSTNLIDELNEGVDEELLPKTKKESKRICLSFNYITASRELNCIKILESSAENIAKKEQEAAKKSKEQAKENAKKEEARIVSIMKSQAKEFLSEVLPLTKIIKGNKNIEIVIDSVVMESNSPREYSLRKTKSLGVDVVIPISEIDPTIASKKVILWSPKTLLKEQGDQSIRTGKVVSEYSKKLMVGETEYDVEYTVSFAGEKLFEGGISILFIKDNIIPTSIYQGKISKGMRKEYLAFEEKKDESKDIIRHSPMGRRFAFNENTNPYSYNFKIFRATKLYNNVKQQIAELIQKEYLKDKNHQLIKEFPTRVSLKDIDETYNANIFALLLKDFIKDAFNEANPIKQSSDPASGAAVLGALSVALSANNGNAFDMEKFANALPFDAEIKEYIAKDKELNALYNLILKKQSAQALVKAQAVHEREKNFQTAYDRRVNKEAEKMALALYDSQDEFSLSLLATISKAVEFVKNDEKIPDDKLGETIEISGTITKELIDDPQFKGMKKYIQKITFDENTPNFVKRILGNFQINPEFSPVEYYKEPISADFKATFSVVKEKGMFLPRIIFNQ